MKKIIGLAVAAIMLMTLAGAGTFAFFSDTESSSGNQILAGSLYLTPDTTHFFTTSTDFNDIKPGTTHDEYVVLTPSGTVTSANRLSIQMKNMWLDQSGFLALVSPTPQIHKLDGTAYTSADVGDMGKDTKVVLWLSNTNSPTPAGTDIVLMPGLDSGGTGTFTSIFNSTDWNTIWASSSITNYNYAGYFNTASSPTAVNTQEFHWNDVLGEDMGTTVWYFHVTFNFPDSGTQSDNVFQAEKVSNDFYFTLATTNAPY